MKRALLLICILVAAVPLWAELKPVQFDVPFSFAIGGKVLPAGAYFIHYGDSFIYIHAGRTWHSFAARRESGLARKRTDVRFKLGENGYRLCKIPGILTDYCQ